MNTFFLQTIDKTILDFNMLKPMDSVLVAVSGGPDSIALVLSLLSLKKKDISIGIAHLNHLLRGEESTRDETFVKNFALKLDLPFHCKQKDVAAYAKKHKLSVEEAGRDVRYNFFNYLSDRHKYTKIATGHTKDDNAELVLINLLRGTGPKGLSGIPPIRDNKFIRPLIKISKKQIFKFLSKKKQDYMIDSSNKNRMYLRNRIRNELMPHLQSEYNPEIINGLDRLSHILRQEEIYLCFETDKQFKTCLIKEDASSVVFSKTLLGQLHPALLNRVLREAIRKIKLNLKRISLLHMNDIIDFCFSMSSGTSLDLPGQIRVYKNKDMIILKKETKPLREIGKEEKKLRRLSKEKQEKER